MSKINTFFRLLKNDRRTMKEAFGYTFARMNISHLFSDETYIKIRYRAIFGTNADLKNPKSFNEKLNWLKLHNRKPEYSNLVDKVNVKPIVSALIGAKYVVPTLKVWENPDAINLDELPEKFVLKCNHDSGSTIVCADRSKFNLDEAKKKLKEHQKKNLFWWGREWPYKAVKPLIFAEEYKKDSKNENLPVYKFMCFNGEPKIIQTIQNDKHPEETIDYFTPEWELLNMRQDFPNSPIPIDKPEKLEEMLEIARTLSAGHPFIRVDLFSVDGEIFFSEYTFYSDCGFARFEPSDWDKKLGDWIDLGSIK